MLKNNSQAIARKTVFPFRCVSGFPLQLFSSHLRIFLLKKTTINKFHSPNAVLFYWYLFACKKESSGKFLKYWILFQKAFAIFNWAFQLTFVCSLCFFFLQHGGRSSVLTTASSHCSIVEMVWQLLTVGCMLSCLHGNRIMCTCCLRTVSS